jgi:hypothetical protein
MLEDDEEEDEEREDEGGRMPRATERRKVRSGRERVDVSSRGVMYCMTLLKEKKEREILRQNISAVKLNLGEEGVASKKWFLSKRNRVFASSLRSVRHLLLVPL